MTKRHWYDKAMIQLMQDTVEEVEHVSELNQKEVLDDKNAMLKINEAVEHYKEISKRLTDKAMKEMEAAK